MNDDEFTGEHVPACNTRCDASSHYLLGDDDNLRAIAEAARVVTALAHEVGCGETWDVSTLPSEVTEHFVTFDPPTVLALLDRVQTAEAELNALRAAVDEAGYRAMWQFFLSLPSPTPFSDMVQREAMRLRALTTPADQSDEADDVGCGNCGRPLTGQTGYTGSAAYHRECARLVYGDQFADQSDTAAGGGGPCVIREWTDWLASINYGVDYGLIGNVAPPCTLTDLAEAYVRVHGEEDAETWAWCITQETGVLAHYPRPTPPTATEASTSVEGDGEVSDG